MAPPGKGYSRMANWNTKTKLLFWDMQNDTRSSKPLLKAVGWTGRASLCCTPQQKTCENKGTVCFFLLCAMLKACHYIFHHETTHCDIAVISRLLWVTTGSCEALIKEVVCREVAPNGSRPTSPNENKNNENKSVHATQDSLTRSYPDKIALNAPQWQAINTNRCDDSRRDKY